MLTLYIEENKITDWECDHENTETESRDFGRPDPIAGDYVDDWRNCEVCKDCGAYKAEGDYDWEDDQSHHEYPLNKLINYKQ